MYRKSVVASRLERKRKQCAAMRAAKERKRLAAAAECGSWTTRRVEFEASFSPCGKYVGLRAVNGPWTRCGSERAVRIALGRVLWRHKPALGNRPGE